MLLGQSKFLFSNIFLISQLFINHINFKFIQKKNGLFHIKNHKPHVLKEELYQKFKDKLKSLCITITWKWEDASCLIFNEPEWKSIRTFSEKRNLFNDYINDLKNKEREEIYLKREKNKAKFRQLLSEDNTINSDSTYTEVMHD